MSKTNANQSIDYRRLALKKACLSGQLEQSQLQDMQQEISTAQTGVVDYCLYFNELKGLSVIEGQVETTLSLLCLRCLQPMSCPTKCAIKLAILEDESQLKSVPQDYEAWILADKALTLEALLAEELLLSMPLDLRHDAQDCSYPEQEKEQKNKLMV